MIDNKCNARKKHAWYNLKKVQPQKDYCNLCDRKNTQR